MARLISEQDIERVKGFTRHIAANGILPFLDEVQDIIIRPLLKDPLYTELCEQTETNTLTPANAALLPYVQMALIYHVYARYVRWGGIQSTATGMKKKVADESENPTPSEISSLYATAKQDAEIYEARMMDFLKDNSSDYPSHDCGCGHKHCSTKTSWGIF